MGHILYRIEPCGVGMHGQTIYSASNGMVVYSGQGLPLYGKLIIVKHNETYLSAYAHNKKLLVKEGDEVNALSLDERSKG